MGTGGPSQGALRSPRVQDEATKFISNEKSIHASPDAPGAACPLASCRQRDRASSGHRADCRAGAEQQRRAADTAAVDSGPERLSLPFAADTAGDADARADDRAPAAPDADAGFDTSAGRCGDAVPAYDAVAGCDAACDSVAATDPEPQGDL
ncbi:hypothetical protein [Sphingomonas sp. MA1305]|uniref:hypothetical protein n=1 Tax=Sphingomonas sp. MA1305 TaxID=2479204 RepID=UPI0018DF0B0C|nr:hypothetical protein [Sphingomonas sp. MA1305]